MLLLIIFLIADLSTIKKPPLTCVSAFLFSLSKCITLLFLIFKTPYLSLGLTAVSVTIELFL